MSKKRWTFGKRKKLIRGMSAELERLTALTEELRDMREAEQHARDELARERERAEKAEAELNAKVKQLTKARNRARGDRDKLAEQLEDLKNSQSFKVGHAIVQMVRLPVVVIRKLGTGARKLGTGARKLRLPARKPAQLESAAAKTAAKTRESESEQGKKADKAEQTKPALTIPSNDLFLGPLFKEHSTTMFLVWGFSDDALEALVGDVAQLQVMNKDFNPLFVTDSDSWAPFQKREYWFEYIPPAEEWMQHNEETAWSEFVTERIDSIVATYAPDRIVVYEDAGKREALKQGVLTGVVGNGRIPIESASVAGISAAVKPSGNNDASAGPAVVAKEAHPDRSP